MRALIAVLGLPPALAVLAAAAPARGPYLVDASSVSARVCWRAGGADECRALTGLAPGAVFSYAVEGGTYSARTLPPPGRPLVFAAFGDSGWGGEEQSRVARVLARQHARLVLLLGDIVYPRGSDEDYDRKHFQPYGELLSRVPFFTVIGNHDYGNSRFLRWRGERRYREGYARVHRRPKYYSFSAGDALFIALDANEVYPIAAAEPIGPGSAQRRWLEGELARPAAWKFVFLHIPLYSSGFHGGSKRLRPWLEELFSRHGVDVVFQGHDHFYERSRPIGGVVYVTAGTGGAPLHGPRSRQPWSAAQVESHGFVLVRVEGRRLELTMMDDQGVARDQARWEKP